MGPTLYMYPPSPPVRSVLITAKAIGLDLNLKVVNVTAGENRTPEYHKINPQHTVPALVDDDGFTLTDSHVIITYLVSKYAKNDSLYPKDLKKRALIDQRLHSESGTVFPSVRNIVKGIVYENKTSIDDKAKEAVYESYQLLETFLEKNPWMAGDAVSVADYSIISSVSSINTLVPVEAQKYPKLTAWMKKMETLPEYEVNKEGLTMFEQFFKNKLSK